MIKILQINLGGGCRAQNLALQAVAKNSVGIIVVSEYYKYGTLPHNWYCDPMSRVAITLVSPIAVDEQGANDGFVWLKLGNVYVFSSYWSPNSSIAKYEDFLRCLEVHARNITCEVIIAGDFNAKHHAWSSPINDGRGNALVEMVYSLDLTVCNRGSTSTRGPTA